MIFIADKEAKEKEHFIAFNSTNHDDLAGNGK